MLDASQVVLDQLRLEYPGAFKGWDGSRVRLTIDEVDDGEKGRIILLTILFQLQDEKQKQSRRDRNSGGKESYRVHKVLLSDVRSEETRVGGEELISEFYTVVDEESR